jgi:hypothetical protein
MTFHKRSIVCRRSWQRSPVGTMVLRSLRGASDSAPVTAPTRQSDDVEWRPEPRLAPALERASQRVTVVVSVALLSVRFGSG